VILIDESQDTMIGMLEALMQVADEEPSRLTLGLLGDHRQRIYPDGHRDLPSCISKSWALPKLEMNHRSQHRIVELINRIWKADLEGRTQPTAGIQQYSRTEKSGGTVQIFIGDANLGPEDKIRREALCAKEMANIAGHPEWDNPTGGYQVLALEHKLAARRGNFSDVFNAMLLIDPDSAKPQGNGDNNGPSSVQVLLHEIPALVACIDGEGHINEFAVLEVLNRYDRLQGLPSDVTGQQARLTELNNAVLEFVSAYSKPESTVREILGPVIQNRLFELDERLVRALLEPGPPPPVPKCVSDEPIDVRRRRGWHGLFNSLWAEVGRYKIYLEGRSNLSTHQVVKGSEFEHVMVVMDDQEAGGNLFSYDKLFGAVPLSPRDQANATENKETTIDRTLRLLYVTCSRARESLALVLWSLDPETAIRSIKAGGWFTETEIQRVPQI
jgi:DNA helicase-2/ATP-dependent DNA helicase PcrA